MTVGAIRIPSVARACHAIGGRSLTRHVLPWSPPAASFASSTPSHRRCSVHGIGNTQLCAPALLGPAEDRMGAGVIPPEPSRLPVAVCPP